ncbi:response regulator receiver protein [Desulfobulbus propionicus DSM 2032]|uniref:Response regulator receiver protein n=1 Tax=Desulfobulbus propionicus (strain ATCC 33891 / DSM 2032 / VKM B-1956 / 1pr3) TaxID=577650 RepID=A0A7U3YKU5_DESPD|nr:response regulator [Desulfobulbus propionicus]ADW17241.1 response regulator receiver protein [Desulfobulbus propionicus DSM 2032]
MRILVIDDDEQMRILLRQVMEWAGYEVTEAGDGREGMHKQRRQPANLVITDLIMPEQEGLKTITSLKKEFPEVKIIAISGGGRIGPEAYLPAAQELGADRVFSKPFEVRELVDAVKELLEHE